MYTIKNYWDAIKNSVNIEDPIYKWTCFDSETKIREYISQISDVLSSINFNTEPYGERKIAFSCLFLIRCALLCRIDQDWDLECKDVFFNDIGQYNFDRATDWRWCITEAERVLHRTPLIRYKADSYTERNAKKYCARVLVEAGLPLKAFQGTDEHFTKVAEGLRNIYKLYSSTMSETAYERTIKQFMASGNLHDPKGQSFWLPGGYAGCRDFFSIGLELLESIDSDDSSKIKKSLREHGFENPSNESVDFIFGLHKYQYNKRPVIIKRILFWEDDMYDTSACIEYTPALNLPDTHQLELKISNKTIATWTYDQDGRLNGENRLECYDEHVFYSAILKKDSDQIEILGSVDYSNPIFFKNIAGNKYEWVSTSSFKPTDFPICVIFPNGYIEDHNINLSDIESTNLSIENETISYQVYKFNNEYQLNKAGLSFASSQLVLNPPAKYFTISFFDSTGAKHRNPILTTEYPREPLRNLQSFVLSSEDRQNWNKTPISVDEDDFYFAYYKLNSAAATDPGCGILILPREFDYVFIPDQCSNSFKGIQFQYKNDDGETKTIENIDVFIDGEKASETAWNSIKHNSIIRCVIRNSRNEEIHLIIPSPIIGASWFYSENADSDLSSKKNISAVNYKTSVKLNCVLQSMDRFDVLYKIKLVDNNETLLEFTDCLVPLINGHNTYFLDLPPYLEKLFSATNSLSAKLNIIAEVRNSNNTITTTDALEITRFDESNYEGHFFCIGLLNQEVLAIDSMPNSEELQRELWIKVPAYLSSEGNAKWNHRNRIRLINNFITETSTLTDFQKLLLGNDYLQVQSQIRNFFDNHCNDLGEDEINIIEKCFDLCVNYDIPICNLWVLQATIQDDRIFVQLPSIYKFKHLLNDNTFLCSFDWQLIRPSSLNYAKDDKIKKLIKKQIDNENIEIDNNVEIGLDIDENGIDYMVNGLPEPPFVDEDDFLTSWKSEAFKEQLAKDDINCSANLSDYELLLYFIVRQVIYGENEFYQKRLNWATLCLKYLKCINAFKTKKSLQKIRKEIKNIYKVNQHQAGYSSIVWDKWKSGKFKDSITCGNISENDPYKQGQNDALNTFPERYWLELLKKFTYNSDNERFYFDLYRYPYPSGLSKTELEKKAQELEIKYKQYKVYYEQGWNQFDCTDSVQTCCYLPHLNNIDAFKDIPIKAPIVGKIAHSWFKEWTKKVDVFNINDKLKTYIKKLIPIQLLDLTKDESELGNIKSEDLGSLSEKINDYLEIAKQEGNNLPNNFTGVIKSLLRNSNKIRTGLDACKCFSDFFGDYKANYYLFFCNLRAPESKKIVPLWESISKKFLDQDYYLYKASCINCNTNDFDTIRIAFEKAASLGNKKALVKLADQCNTRAKQSNQQFYSEFDNQQKFRKYDEIEFIGKLKDAYKETISLKKSTIHYYKTAARLNDAEACYKYYEEISELKQDKSFIRPLIEKVLRLLNNNLSNDLLNDAAYLHTIESAITKLKEDIRRCERDKYIFDKWCNLDNEWVFLRKAYLKKISIAEIPWEYMKTSYEDNEIDPRDGQKYVIVKLGKTCWFAEDLKYESGATKQCNGKCYYTNNAAKNAIFRNWRLPTIEDIKQLREWCAQHSIRKDPAGVSLKSERWKSSHKVGDVLSGTDDFGFAANPSGLMIKEYDEILRKDEAFYWTSSESSENIAHCANISSSHNELGITTMSKDYCLAVRLVRDID